MFNSAVLRHIILAIALVVFASGILLTSILRTTAPQYAFSAPKSPVTAASTKEKKEVDYYLVYPGILPDHFLWSGKALRDKIWLFLTTDPVKKSELLLLFADKRLGAGRVLLDGGKNELAVSSITKAEKYLEEAAGAEERARQKGLNTEVVLDRLVLATLKHREVLEEMYIKAPEDARPVIAEVLNYPKRLFDNLKTILRELGRTVPESPFE